MPPGSGGICMMRESEWIRAAAAGDPHAFAQLVARYQKPVYNLVLRTVGNEQDALDLTQDAINTLAGKLGKIEGISAKTAYSNLTFPALQE